MSMSHDKIKFELRRLYAAGAVNGDNLGADIRDTSGAVISFLELCPLMPEDAEAIFPGCLGAVGDYFGLLFTDGKRIYGAEWGADFVFAHDIYTVSEFLELLRETAED